MENKDRELEAWKRARQAEMEPETEPGPEPGAGRDAETAEIIEVLAGEGVHDVEALRDLIYDYHMQARQGREIHRRYIAPAATMAAGGVELCPRCGMEVRPTWRHCAWCGQRIRTVITK